MRIFALGLLLAAAACDGRRQQEPATAAAPSGTWLRGTVDDRFSLVEKHLRGFDVAMMETGYRYDQLYWASRDRNWEYASYQLEKIGTAIANGLERRPKRAASARMFDGPVAGVRTAIEQRDGVALDGAITALTAMCNACHAAEKVAFIHVAPPTERHSSVAPPSPPIPPSTGAP